MSSELSLHQLIPQDGKALTRLQRRLLHKSHQMLQLQLHPASLLPGNPPLLPKLPVGMFTLRNLRLMPMETTKPPAPIVPPLHRHIGGRAYCKILGEVIPLHNKRKAQRRNSLYLSRADPRRPSLPLVFLRFSRALKRQCSRRKTKICLTTRPL